MHALIFALIHLDHLDACDLEIASGLGAPIGEKRRQHMAHSGREIYRTDDVALEVGQVADGRVRFAVADNKCPAALSCRAGAINAGEKRRRGGGTSLQVVRGEEKMVQVV